MEKEGGGGDGRGTNFMYRTKKKSNEKKNK